MKPRVHRRRDKLAINSSRNFASTLTSQIPSSSKVQGRVSVYNIVQAIVLHL